MTHHESMDALLDRYLDDQLSPAEREAFERSLETDPRLREQVALQHHLDGSLGRLFTQQPEASPIPIAAGRRKFSTFQLLGIAAAAAVLLAAPAALIIWTSGAGSATGHPALTAQRPTLRQTYASTVASGFQPAEICTTPDAFEAWVQRNYHSALRPTGDDPGVRLVGWSYSGVISSYTGLLLARVDEQPVLVVLDRAELERRPTGHGEGQQNIFERRIGDLVLYEVTPLGQPRVLPLLSPGS